MTYLNILIYCIIGLYGVLSLYYFIGLTKNICQRGAELPAISILVAARNEELNLPACLASLSELEYPPEKLEIIIIDDQSEDNTAEITAEFIKDKPQFRLIKMADMPQKNLPGKTGALAAGIPLAKGDIIVQTDADCTVTPQWANELVKYFSDDVGGVGGFTIFRHPQRKLTLFEKLANIDLIYLLGIGSGSANNGKPLSCIGNNFAFRKNTYLDVGGYENIRFSVTEDFALMRTINKEAKKEVLLPIDKNCVVYTYPVESFRKFIKQRRRWAKGGFQPGFLGFWLSMISLAAHLSVIALFSLSDFSRADTAALALFFLSDIILLGTTLKRLRLLYFIKWYPLYKIFTILYGIVVVVSLIFKPQIEWKGRNF